MSGRWRNKQKEFAARRTSFRYQVLLFSNSIAACSGDWCGPAVRRSPLKKQKRKPSVSRTTNKRFTQLLQFFDNSFARSQDVSGMKNHIAFLVAPVLRLSIIYPVT